jgi:hypothetical protein
MRGIGQARRTAVLLLLGGGLAVAQSVSTMPGTAPTAPVAGPPPAVDPPSPVVHRAVIVYSLGQLTVLAENSSLNQILRDIARATGMKLTGNMADERVFGKYGPGAPAEILAGLLDGTGINMMLRENASSGPAELVLTPRNGPPTPPDPNAAREEAAREEEDGRNGRANPVGQSFDAAPIAGQERRPPEPPSGPSIPGQPATPPPPGVYIPPPPPPVPPRSPNGVSTPQQIYEQLQQMQQQQTTNP